MSESTWTTLVDAHVRSQRPQSGPAPEHEPVAAILCCSDARVPPSIIFDQPAGRLFVVRIAGNTASPAALASLDYAVGVLGVDLLVVLGHTGCGAVEAALHGRCGGHLAPIVEPICALVRDHPALAHGPDLDEVVAVNVAWTVATLLAHSGPVGQAARAGSLDVRGAIHDLASGLLRPLQSLDPAASDFYPPTPLETL